MAFPSIVAPSYGTSGEVYLPQIRSEFESNYVQSRPAASRSVTRWNLVWEAMPEADFQTLRTFFLANQGNTFDWTEPVTTTAYVCRFSGNALSWSHLDKGFRKVELQIEEI